MCAVSSCSSFRCVAILLILSLGGATQYEELGPQIYQKCQRWLGEGRGPYKQSTIALKMRPGDYLEDRKGSENHLPEAKPGVAIGGPKDMPCFEETYAF